MPGLLRFQADCVVDGLVAGHHVCGYVHEPYRLGGGDDGRHLLVDGKLLHFPVGGLRLDGVECGGEHDSRKDLFKRCSHC